MRQNNVLLLRNFNLPSEPGVHFRLVRMTGEKKGETYYLKGKRVVLGRSEDCDIQVLDSKASREHAEIIQVGPNFVLTDLKSQNGILVNDFKVNQHHLKNGDIVVVGKTVFKFGRIQVEEEKSEKFEVEDKDEPEAKEVKDENVSRNKIVLLLFVLGLIFFGIDDNPEPKRRKRVGGLVKEFGNGLSNLKVRKNDSEDKELKQKLESIFQKGLRELREGNYYRAIHEFNLALILSPRNGRAVRYIQNAKKELDSKIEKTFLKARKDSDALRYQSAIKSYCSIMRLLQTNPEDERFLDAQGNIKKLEVILDIEEGQSEAECL